MRSEFAIEADIADVKIEMRGLHDKVVDTSSAADVRAAKRELEALVRRQARLEREKAELARPQGRAGRLGLVTRDALLKAAAERRSLVIGESGIGAISQIRELFREIAETDDILNHASYYYGPNAATMIPVLSPMDDPQYYEEGASDVAQDAAAGVTVTEIQPMAIARELPVSAEMLQMGAVDIEAELPAIFTRAFQKFLHYQMLNGSGTGKNIKGIFTSALANTAGQTTAAGSAITVTELAGLALKVASKDASFRIIMSPQTYQAILSDATDSEDIKIYKEGLIRDKSIEGVQVLLDAYAPAYSASGDVLAVACPLSRYAFGVAGELHIEPIRKPQDTQTYYQAIMFASGKQVSDTDLYSLVAGA